MSEYGNAYSKGYNAGRRGTWPPHKPPLPPDDIVRGLIVALRELRDGIDGQIAMFSEDDPINLAVGPLIDQADESLSKVTAWVLEVP